jgi:hypothetical protein
MLRRVESLIALMMEAVRTYETSVNFYQTARRNIPEDDHVHIISLHFNTYVLDNTRMDKSIYTRFDLRNSRLRDKGSNRLSRLCEFLITLGKLPGSLPV